MTIIETFAHFDAMWEEATATAPITCRGEGCFGCCKEPVQASRAEAAAIVAGLSPQEKEGVAVRTARWLAMVRASGLLTEPEPSVVFWRMVQAWCPLLVDGRCMAYALRPISCRAHAASSDPAYCHDDKLRAKQTYVSNDRVTLESFGDAIEEEGTIETDHLGVWLAEMILGKITPSAGRWTLRGHIEGETLVLENAHECPRFQKGKGTRL